MDYPAAAYHPMQIMEKTASLVHRLGFSTPRRRAYLAMVGLTGSDHRWARYLQKYIIRPHCETLVDHFATALLANPEARALLSGEHTMAHLRTAQSAYLRTLGTSFGGAGYFESRLQIGHAHARAAVPLTLYLASYCQLQLLILAHVPATLRADPARYEAFVAFLLKITALDMALATETYHRSRVGELEQSITALRHETTQLHRLVDTDTFTGLANHAHILNVLTEALRRTGGAPLSLIIADLDAFKAINDAYGHPVGDQVIHEVTARMQAAARRGDVLGRYGGDEFIIVLKDTTLATAKTIAKRIRAHVGDQPLELDGRTIHVTMSLGVASAQAGEDADTFIARADHALYQAKQTGRNRVVVSPAVTQLVAHLN